MRKTPLICLFLGVACQSYGMYKLPLDGPTAGQGWVRVAGRLRLYELNGEDLRKNLNKPGYFQRDHNYEPEQRFYVTPGTYSAQIKLQHYEIEYYGRWSRTITHESETRTIEFTVGADEIVCLCYELIDGTNPGASVVKIEARRYTFPDEFKVPLHVPYLSRYLNTPYECNGEKMATTTEDKP